ncbi:hypothetical protein V7112_06330, partial [Bacillus sp. JJ1566]
KNEIQDVQKEIIELMTKKGYLAFSFPAIHKAEKILKEKKSDDHIYGIEATFIDQLIEEQKCICGTTIKEHTPHYHHLVEIKKLTNTTPVEQKVMDSLMAVGKIKERKETLFKELRQLKAIEISKIQIRKKLNEEIEEIGLKLSEKDSEEISELETRRQKLSQQKNDLLKKIGAIENELKSIEKKLKEKKVEQSKAQNQADKAKLTNKRVEVCETLEEVMKDILEIRESLVKSQLHEKINKVYSQFLRKDFSIELSDSYELRVVNSKGNLVGMSQGERQITSLSFIGAIVDIAREQYKKEIKNKFEEGGIYPIVMDSPFGALDSDHRKRIGKGIYKLADQLIVIVSTSQWKGEVEEQMNSLIGREYRLVYNDPRINKDKPYEFTSVKEVI